jgi:predicted  nucleic acid-binding Zn-ribbon protein
MNYELKIDQLLQASVHQLQMLSSKISQSTVGQLAGRAIIHLRKNSFNEYLQDNLGSVPRVILIANLGAAVLSGIIFRSLKSKAKNPNQSPQERANQGIKTFTATALVLNTSLYLFTNSLANSSWIIALTLAQTIAATAFFKNREPKETQGQLKYSEIHQKEKEKFQTDLASKDKLITETQDQLKKLEKEYADLSTKSNEYEESLKNSHHYMKQKQDQLKKLEKEYADLSTKSNEYEESLKNSHHYMKQKQDELKKLEKEYADLSTKSNEYEESLKNSHHYMKQKQDELNSRDKQIIQYQQRVKEKKQLNNEVKFYQIGAEVKEKK